MKNRNQLGLYGRVVDWLGIKSKLGLMIEQNPKKKKERRKNGLHRF